MFATTFVCIQLTLHQFVRVAIHIIVALPDAKRAILLVLAALFVPMFHRRAVALIHANASQAEVAQWRVGARLVALFAN